MKNFKIHIRLIVLGGLMSLMALGCGYTTGSLLPRNTKIYIKSFQNKIDFSTTEQRNVYIPHLEVDVKNAVVDRFLFYGQRPVNDPEGADLILEAELAGYDRSALRFTENDDVEEYRIQILVNMSMTNTKRPENSWAENGFVGETTYFLTGPNATSESQAIEKAVDDLARRIVERTVEDW